jgi:hypothetical protein
MQELRKTTENLRVAGFTTEAGLGDLLNTKPTCLTASLKAILKRNMLKAVVTYWNTETAAKQDASRRQHGAGRNILIDGLKKGKCFTNSSERRCCN